jgi:hypothetical protein
MVAELQSVANSLRLAGIKPSVSHDWVKPQQKGEFLVAGLDEGGHVAEVELRAWDESAQLFKIQKDNQNSFPAYKLDAPLCSVAASDPAREELKNKDLAATQRAAILRRLCAASKPLTSDAERKRLRGRLQEFARELQPVFAEHRQDAPAIYLLIERLLREDLDIGCFLSEIKEAVLAEISAGRDTQKRTGEVLLIGTVNPRTSQVNQARITKRE